MVKQGEIGGEPITRGIRYPDGVVAVMSPCLWCGGEILLTYYACDCFPCHKFIKYLCNCGFETLIPIEDAWRYNSSLTTE